MYVYTYSVANLKKVRYMHMCIYMYIRCAQPQEGDIHAYVYICTYGVPNLKKVRYMYMCIWCVANLPFLT